MGKNCVCKFCKIDFSGDNAKHEMCKYCQKYLAVFGTPELLYYKYPHFFEYKNIFTNKLNPKVVDFVYATPLLKMTSATSARIIIKSA